MREGLLTGPGAKSLGSSLSGPIFSGPINRARFGSERHATEIIRLRVGAHWAGFAVPFAKPLEPGSNDQRTALGRLRETTVHGLLPHMGVDACCMHVSASVGLHGSIESYGGCTEVTELCQLSH